MEGGSPIWPYDWGKFSHCRAVHIHLICFKCPTMASLWLKPGKPRACVCTYAIGINEGLTWKIFKWAAWFICRDIFVCIERAVYICLPCYRLVSYSGGKWFACVCMFIVVGQMDVRLYMKGSTCVYEVVFFLVLWVFIASVGIVCSYPPFPQYVWGWAWLSDGGFWGLGGGCLAAVTACIFTTPSAKEQTLAFVYPRWGNENIHERFPGKEN